VAAGDAVLVRAGTKSGETLAILLKKRLGAYFAAHAVTPAGVVINVYQTHVFLL
jgi:acyl-coenzyme A synthetase/AMP-(fatty) acid ligase